MTYLPNIQGSLNVCFPPRALFELEMNSFDPKYESKSSGTLTQRTLHVNKENTYLVIIARDSIPLDLLISIEN